MEIKKELGVYTKWLIKKGFIKTGIDSQNTIQTVIESYLKNALYSDDIIKVVHKLKKELGDNIIFCGSLGLAINNCLNREVHDVDVLILDKELLSKGEISETGSNDFTIDDVEIKVSKMLIDNINVDLFYHDKVKETKYITIDFAGEFIKVESPFGAIKAKQEYVKLNQLSSKDKHIKDLNYINYLMGIEPLNDEDDNLPF